MHEGVTSLNVFTEKRGAPIKEVAYYLYNMLHMYFEDWADGKRFGNDIVNTMQVKTILKLIKYSCTILDEKNKEESAFSKYSVLDLLCIEEDLNPHRWIFITEAQFLAKMRYSVGQDQYLARICPITNYRLLSVFELFSTFKGIPFYILSEESYKLSVKRMLDKCLSKNECTSSIKGTSDCLYIGSLEGLFEKTSTISLSRIQERLAKMLQDFKNNYHYKAYDYDIIVTIETAPRKSCAYAASIKVLFFRRIEGIGYMLEGLVEGFNAIKATSRVLYTPAMPQDLIEEAVNIIDAEVQFRDRDQDVVMFYGYKCHMILDEVYQMLESNEVYPKMPDFIIIPQ
jgi:hypothetical protein